jgi:hypothetical protein
MWYALRFFEGVDFETFELYEVRCTSVSEQVNWRTCEFVPVWGKHSAPPCKVITFLHKKPLEICVRLEERPVFRSGFHLSLDTLSDVSRVVILKRLKLYEVRCASALIIHISFHKKKQGHKLEKWKCAEKRLNYQRPVRACVSLVNWTCDHVRKTFKSPSSRE